MDCLYTRFAVGLFALTLALCPLEATAQEPFQGLQGPITLSLVDREINYQDDRLRTLNELLDAGYATVREVRQVEENLSALQQQHEELSRSRESQPVHLTLGDPSTDGLSQSVLLILPGFQPGQAGRELIISGQLPDTPTVNYQHHAEQGVLRLENLFLRDLQDRLHAIDDGNESIENELRTLRHKLDMLELQQSALLPIPLLHTVNQSPASVEVATIQQVEQSLATQQLLSDQIAQQVRDHESRLLDRMARVAELKRISRLDSSFEEELKREQILEQIAKAELTVHETRTRENELRSDYLKCLTESSSAQKTIRAALKLYESRQHQGANIALARAHIKYLNWKQTAFYDLYQVDAGTWKEWRLAELEWKTAQKRIQMFQEQQECAGVIASWLIQLIDQRNASVTQREKMSDDLAP